MSTKEINPETVWNETYKDELILTDRHSSVSVFSAIHSDSGPLFRIEIQTRGDLIKIFCSANLTPESAEKLANELLSSATVMREHNARWAAFEEKKQLPEAA